jgi:hypothetical protein
MGRSLLDRIQARIELFRLEQRYTKRHRRSTFVSNAIYVDGEYIYNSPDMTGYSTSSTEASTPSPQEPVASPVNFNSSDSNKPGKRLNRWSSMPGFGSMSNYPGSRTSTIASHQHSQSQSPSHSPSQQHQPQMQDWMPSRRRVSFGIER